MSRSIVAKLMKGALLFALVLTWSRGAAQTSLRTHASLEQGQESYLKAKIDGKDWTATKVSPDEYVSEILQMQGRNGNTELWIQLNEPAAGKTDALVETDLNFYADGVNRYEIKAGKTTITKMDDNWVEGTFSFSATDESAHKTVRGTDGSFRVPNPKSFKH